MSEHDPKEAARKERQTPGVERMLRQFLSVDGPKGATDEYKRGWARNFGRKTGEHSGAMLPRTENQFEQCDDEYCWCKREDK